MERLIEYVQGTVVDLLGRSSGPMHLRLIMQPVVATVLAIRAGLRDARAGEPAFLWTFLNNPDQRKRLARSGWADVRKVFFIAVILDSIYQLAVMHAFFAFQTLIVAIFVAVVPYILVRGPVTRIASGPTKVR